MAWSGSTYRKGNYTTNGWTGDAANNIGIEAGRHDVQDDDFAQGITDCINKNGLNAPTTNLPMGAYKHTNVGAATASTDYARFDQVLDRAGTQAATANISLGGFKITNLADGTASTDAATFGQISANTPAGVINMYGGGSAPTGWLLCDGTAVSRTTYAALFAILSTTYGAGNGTTTFNLPDLRQRFPLGKAAAGTGATLGGTGGAIDHTHDTKAHYHNTTGAGSALTALSAGDHTHTYNRPNTSVATGAGGISVWDNTVSSSTTGTAGAHTHTVSGSIGTVTGGVNGDVAQATTTNNPPFLVVNYIIKT